MKPPLSTLSKLLLILIVSSPLWCVGAWLATMIWSDFYTDRFSGGVQQEITKAAASIAQELATPSSAEIISPPLVIYEKREWLHAGGTSFFVFTEAERTTLLTAHKSIEAVVEGAPAWFIELPQGRVYSVSTEQFEALTKKMPEGRQSRPVWITK